MWNSQALLTSMPGWVRSLSYAASSSVEDAGSLYIVDSAASICRAVPRLSDYTWKLKTTVTWALEGAHGSDRLPLAFKWAALILILFTLGSI